MEAVLDFNEKHHTSYAVPLKIRDLQIAKNIERCKARLGEPSKELTDEPIAIVCYGPSLNDTWEEIRNFRYVFTGSGSHKFLIERGFDPAALAGWWHAEVDPRSHKIDLMGPPQKGIQYLIAATCHPKLFDHLEGFDVKLWHIFDSEEEGLRMLPRGEWAITGGQNVGLRQITLARCLGFRNQHVFGMDGSEGASGKHAAHHPMQPKKSQTTEYDGVTYQTTVAMLECAKRTFHELDQMPDTSVKFYGKGLVQHMAANYQRQPAPNGSAIALSKPELISAEYAELNAQLHRDCLHYGIGGDRHAERVLKLCEQYKTQSVLDYGCGKGQLAKSLPFPIWEYDPAIPGKQESPRAADVCVCTDVLEHIEPDKIHLVLDDIRRCTKVIGFLAVHTGPSGKTLADGRNTHLIQEGQEWWAKMIGRYFKIDKIVTAGPERYFIVRARQGKVTANVAKAG